MSHVLAVPWYASIGSRWNWMLQCQPPTSVVFVQAIETSLATRAIVASSLPVHPETS